MTCLRKLRFRQLPPLPAPCNMATGCRPHKGYAQVTALNWTVACAYPTYFIESEMQRLHKVPTTNPSNGRPQALCSVWVVGGMGRAWCAPSSAWNTHRRFGESLNALSSLRGILALVCHPDQRSGVDAQRLRTVRMTSRCAESRRLSRVKIQQQLRSGPTTKRHGDTLAVVRASASAAAPG